MSENENTTPKPTAPKATGWTPPAQKPGPKPTSKVKVENAAKKAGDVVEEVVETAGKAAVDAAEVTEEKVAKGGRKLSLSMKRIGAYLSENKTLVVGIGAAAVALTAAIKILSEKTIIVADEMSPEDEAALKEAADEAAKKND